MCPPGEYAIAYIVKHNVYYLPDGEINWSYDNTGLNSICLICKNWELRCSSQGPWGQWFTAFKDTPDQKFQTKVNSVLQQKINPPAMGAPICEKGLQAAYLENQKYQGSGGAWHKNDDMGLYYFGMYCGQDAELLRPLGMTPMSGDVQGKRKVKGMQAFGKDQGWDCGPNNAICGIQTMNYNPARRTDVGAAHARSYDREAPNTKHLPTDPNRSIIYDDVALSGVNFKCCPIQHHVKNQT